MTAVLIVHISAIAHGPILTSVYIRLYVVYRYIDTQIQDRLSEFLAANPEVPGSIPGTTTFF
jgi:hypothetical protein